MLDGRSNRGGKFALRLARILRSVSHRNLKAISHALDAI
jgi:hypothetical protein